MINNFLHKGGLKTNYNRLRTGAVIVAIVCLFVFISLNDAKGTDWVHYGRDDLGNDSFYDRDSISNVSKGVIKVWTKRVYSDVGRESVINDYEKSGVESVGYESLSYSKELFFIVIFIISVFVPCACIDSCGFSFTCLMVWLCDCELENINAKTVSIKIVPIIIFLFMN